MKKLFGIKILAAVLMIAALTTDSFATTRLRFARGRTSTTVSGSLRPGASAEYVIRVRRNQSMSIYVRSGNNDIVIDVDDVRGHLEYGNGFMIVDTRANGDHWITLRNDGRRPTRFSLSVSVR